MSYRRVLLKVSGEALLGSQEYGISQAAAQQMAQKIRDLSDIGLEIALVIGGGNIFRAIQQGESAGLERTPADQIGMLATLINGLALQEALSRVGCESRLMSALECPKVAESYQWKAASRYLNAGEILIFVGGTGHPYFTTDTAAALRACEIQADILLKATMRVDGVYDKDPRKHKDAIKFETLSYQKVLEMQLGIMDLSAVAMCMSAKIPIRVFNFNEAPLEKIFSDKAIGTLIE